MTHSECVGTLGSFQVSPWTVWKLVNNSLNLRRNSIFQREKSEKCASYVKSNMVYNYDKIIYLHR
jgi:hypothetical protein